MANIDHTSILSRGVDAWNAWRSENPGILPDLSGFSVRTMHPSILGLDLSHADFRGADLSGTDFYRCWLVEADFTKANLQGAVLGEVTAGGAKFRDASLAGAVLGKAHLYGADFSRANFCSKGPQGETPTEDWWMNKPAMLNDANLEQTDMTGAILASVDLRRTNLRGANLSHADLHGANLELASLVGSIVEEANFNSCRVYGISAWVLKGSPCDQKALVVTSSEEPNQPTITVDNLEVAQFVYLLLHNEKIRQVIDTITTKAVLILGRFTEERKKILDALREELHQHDYLPILFDFDVPATRDITETVSLLARMARFIIADLTDPSSIPKELEAIVPGLAVPVQPLLEGSTRPYAMFKDYWKYDWVLPVHRYEGLNPLLETLAEKVIAPAEAKVKALEERRRTIEAELTAPRTSP